MSEQKNSFIYKNSLSIAFLLLAFISLAGQAFTGVQQYNEFLSDHNYHTARRLNIKYKDKESNKSKFVHTISSTMVTDRTVLAILENFQQNDGTVKVPDVLKHYFPKEYLGK